MAMCRSSHSCGPRAPIQYRTGLRARNIPQPLFHDRKWTALPGSGMLASLMLATIVEGRLMGINPYGQPGVEKYKQNMNRILGRK